MIYKHICGMFLTYMLVEIMHEIVMVLKPPYEVPIPQRYRFLALPERCRIPLGMTVSDFGSAHAYDRFYWLCLGVEWSARYDSF